MEIGGIAGLGGGGMITLYLIYKWYHKYIRNSECKKKQNGNYEIKFELTGDPSEIAHNIKKVVEENDGLKKELARQLKKSPSFKKRFEMSRDSNDVFDADATGAGATAPNEISMNRTETQRGGAISEVLKKYAREAV